MTLPLAIFGDPANPLYPRSLRVALISHELEAIASRLEAIVGVSISEAVVWSLFPTALDCTALLTSPRLGHPSNVFGPCDQDMP